MGAIRLEHELSTADKAADEAARKMVWRLEQQNPGEPHAINLKIREFKDKAAFVTRPQKEDITNVRIGEIALAYAAVSDGNLGIDDQANPDRLRILAEVYEGRAQGGLLESQKMALTAGKLDLITPATTERMARYHAHVFALSAAGDLRQAAPAQPAPQGVAAGLELKRP